MPTSMVSAFCTRVPVTWGCPEVTRVHVKQMIVPTIICRARSTLRALFRMAVPPVLSSTSAEYSLQGSVRLYQYLRQRGPEKIAACPRGVLAGRFCLLRSLHSSCFSLSHSFCFRLSHSCCLSRQRILPRETGRPKCGPGRSAAQRHDLVHRAKPELHLKAF